MREKKSEMFLKQCLEKEYEDLSVSPKPISRLILFTVVASC